MTIRFGFIDNSEGANIRTLPIGEKGSTCLTPEPLPPGTRVTLIQGTGQTPGWSYVSTLVGGYLLRGHVQGFRITLDLPEPAATLYQVQPEDRLEPIAARIYRDAIIPGRDLRFYENVIHHVNMKHGRTGVRRGREGVELVAGKRIWLVSIAYANRLQKEVPSGSITGGALARAKETARHLNHLIASVENAGLYFNEVTGQYAQAIKENWREISAIVAGFIAAEALSTLLAATPTGVGQLAAAIIQLGLAAFGAQGIVDAGVEALKHAELWLTQAWAADRSPELLKEASKSFLRMLMSIAMAALALMGAKANMGRGFKLANSVKITRPRYYMMAAQGPGGIYAGVPVFRPGTITAVQSTYLPFNSWGTGSAMTSKTVKEGSRTQSDAEPTLTERTLSDAEWERLLERLPNWDKLKELVGRKIPKDGTPEFNALKKELEAAGYRLEKMSKGSQPYRIRRLDGKALGDELGALTVTEDGLVVLKVGKGTPRISIYSRYRKNYLDWVEKTHGSAARKAAEVRIAGGNPMHHLIPDAVAQKHPLIRKALERIEGYTIDRGTNILDMPCKNPKGKIMHLGSHPKYNSYVTTLLDDALESLDDALSKRKPGSSLTPREIQDALLEVEMNLREAIESGGLPMEVLKELSEDGIVVGKKLALLELPSHEESLTA
ncbi:MULTISPECIES: AHH domain-containing protein [unclassified Corallococcus]|uniref:AHH domain-containing protein n=1 Tax=unclassified Corallococcus TaxID=2685029 RepID=UPI001A908791|nr:MULTISPECIES: AHH domain-containing protein [unclassified Corallococcus]MBN9687169.1 AHH domain-containing protein [Corallococcus sp. NCSPR001]WAS89004.1 AHH domain-containing protein [Corallococcus sp. NCRR]